LYWKDLQNAHEIYYKDSDRLRDENYYEDALHKPEPETIRRYLLVWGKMQRLGKWESRSLDKAIIDVKAFDFVHGRRLEESTPAYLEGIRSDIEKAFQIVLKAAEWSRKGKMCTSPVAAAKILHIFAPYFAAPWDDSIRTAYGCRRLGYSVFLQRVQQEMAEAVSSYAQAQHFSDLCEAREKLAEELCRNVNKPRSLVKIVDEYNFLKYTRGEAVLWKKRNNLVT
jgi:hypothetical protein